MLKNSSTKLFGNDRYEGYGIDVIHELSVLLGFKYEFKLHPDTVVGEYDNDTNSWTGIIGELRSEVRLFWLSSMGWAPLYVADKW